MKRVPASVLLFATLFTLGCGGNEALRIDEVENATADPVDQIESPKETGVDHQQLLEEFESKAEQTREEVAHWEAVLAEKQRVLREIQREVDQLGGEMQATAQILDLANSDRDKLHQVVSAMPRGTKGLCFAAFKRYLEPKQGETVSVLYMEQVEKYGIDDISANWKKFSPGQVSDANSFQSVFEIEVSIGLTSAIRELSKARDQQLTQLNELKDVVARTVQELEEAGRMLKDSELAMIKAESSLEVYQATHPGE